MFQFVKFEAILIFRQSFNNFQLSFSLFLKCFIFKFENFDLLFQQQYLLWNTWFFRRCKWGTLKVQSKFTEHPCRSVTPTKLHSSSIEITLPHGNHSANTVVYLVIFFSKVLPAILSTIVHQIWIWSPRSHFGCPGFSLWPFWQKWNFISGDKTSCKHYPKWTHMKGNTCTCVNKKYWFLLNGSFILGHPRNEIHLFPPAMKSNVNRICFMVGWNFVSGRFHFGSHVNTLW